MKPTIWHYEVRTEKGWLARVVMTSDGYFSTVSEYGNYAFWWHSFAPQDFRAFFAKCGEDYILSKISARAQWEGDASSRPSRTPS